MSALETVRSDCEWQVDPEKALGYLPNGDRLQLNSADNFVYQVDQATGKVLFPFTSFSQWKSKYAQHVAQRCCMQPDLKECPAKQDGVMLICCRHYGDCDQPEGHRCCDKSITG